MTDGSRIDYHAPKLDIGVPHSARMYDYWLGGKDHFAADRELGDEIVRLMPGVRGMVRANRDWMLRVTRHLVREHGIRQFLDIGTGIPTAPNLHQAAQQIAPECRVVYVDNDPIVLVHARALMTSTPQGRCDFIAADLRQIDQLLADPAIDRGFDRSEPIAIMLASMLMLLDNNDNPHAILKQLRAWAPPGSYLAISHPTADHDPAAVAQVAAVTAKKGMTFVPRTRDQVAELFGDWEWVDPGLVPVLAWRPDQPPDDPNAAYYWTGVTRKAPVQ